MLLSQITRPDGSLAVVVRAGSEAAILRGTASTYDLAMESATTRRPLSEAVTGKFHGEGRVSSRTS